MKIDNMRELYEELLRATSNGYRNRSIANPAVDFTKKAKAGDFDEMSDEEYYQALDKVNELNDVWQHRPSGQIGELLFTALENLTLSDSDVEDMAATLLCAYERSSKEHIPCDAKAADRNERTAGYAASKEIDSDNPSKTHGNFEIIFEYTLPEAVTYFFSFVSFSFIKFLSTLFTNNTPDTLLAIR
jgi:hypothetical protein